ncbi:hypothetical protein G9464_07610 [Halostella sp. JP-L12]|uniref:DUF7109 family protein n=1 Tax=Halostella TaxID=1843185 RepID=UPI000EF77FB2|nr:MULTISPECIES: hypothetical protein [Halostella]NHN47460.1 hypothetical protein [Halostella sp. JP-L12]
MDATHDGLAGIVDLFGALTREELHTALSELAYRRGDEFDPDEADEAVDDAVAAYALVEYDGLIVDGPTAFPTLPQGAEDLPHIMDADERSVDREALGERVRERVREDAEAALDAGDDDRAATLLDVCYDVEAWAPVSLEETRTALDRRV